MSIQKYIAYLRTVETGSITQAAAELGYTQSANSKMIADLESEWQCHLLTRSRTGIEITSEGITLLPAISKIVKDYNELNFTVSEMRSVLSGILRIGSFSSFSISILPALLKSFHELYPNIQFRVLTGEYNDIIGWLNKGSIDCGFLSLPTPASFQTLPLFRDRFVVILPENHPMAQEEVFPISRLTGEHFVWPKEMRDSEITGFLNRYDISFPIIHEITENIPVMAMVEAGLGISIVHDLILYNKWFHLRRVPLEPTQIRTIGLAVRNDSPPSTVTRLFIRHTREEIRSLVPEEDCTADTQTM